MPGGWPVFGFSSSTESNITEFATEELVNGNNNVNNNGNNNNNNDSKINGHVPSSVIGAKRKSSAIDEDSLMMGESMKEDGEPAKRLCFGLGEEPASNGSVQDVEDMMMTPAAPILNDQSVQTNFTDRIKAEAEYKDSYLEQFVTKGETEKENKDEMMMEVNDHANQPNSSTGREAVHYPFHSTANHCVYPRQVISFCHRPDYYGYCGV